MSSFLLCDNCWKGQTKISQGILWSQNKKCCWTTGSSRTSAHSELLNTCQKSVFLFLFVFCYPLKTCFFCIDSTKKKGCFANLKKASFGSNKQMFDLCENLVSVWNRKVRASISFFVVSCLSMNFLPSLKKKQWKSGVKIFLLSL